jgi:chorismate mutase/prephenate dehydratase
MSSRELDQLRASLDSVDREIVALLAQRTGLVSGIGDRKAEADLPLRDLDRERDVLARVEAAAKELGVSLPLVRRVFHELLGHSVDRQIASLAATRADTRPVRVAYQGVEHSYSHLTAMKHLDTQAATGELVGHRSFRDAAADLLSGEADLALLPIENTTAGSIIEVYDILRTEQLAIVGEETCRVDHCLAGPEEVALERVERVLSHPQGLQQCSRFLRTLPHVTPVPYFDTAEAMRAVAELGDPGQAAIGSPEAAEAYGLVVLARGIADQDENHTRFVVLAREPRPVDARVPSKTSLVLVTRHEPGALLGCLAVLAAHRVSLTKLESRPLPGRPWEYLFFVDIEGATSDPEIAAALDELRGVAQLVTVLGSYPMKATPRDPRYAPAS